MTAAEPVSQKVRFLYSDHHEWLHGWLRRELGNAFDAADLAQDTFIRILARGEAPELAESRRHLMQIAKGLVIDLHRRRRVETAYTHALAVQPQKIEPSVESRALVAESLSEVDETLHALSPPVRQALLMRTLEGLSHREIAQKLGVSISSVEKYIGRALSACCEGQGRRRSPRRAAVAVS